MKYFNSLLHLLTVGLLVMISGLAAAQQDYPSRPIRFITPYAPGGTTSIVARLLGQKLTESWGQQVIVDNRGGGNTIIGTDALAKAPHDGYTILLTGSTHVLVPLLFKVPYDPIKDFAPVTTIAKNEFVLLLNPKVPASDLKEFIAYAKSKPGQLNYATPGAGGSQHLAHELLNLTAEIKTEHIPYKGGGPVMIDLIAGQVQLHFSSASPAIPHIRSGKLRAIAITGDTRLPAIPEVPTFAQGGLPALSNAGSFQCILVPAGTPKPIVDKLSAEIAKYLRTPEFEDKLIDQGLKPYPSTPNQLAALLTSSMVTNTNIIKKANIKMED